MRKNKSLEKSATSMLPVIPDINDEIFERAGITKEDRAQMLAAVFQRTKQRLTAKEKKVFCQNGEVIYSKELDDHATQGKAIDQAIQLVGLSKQTQPKVIVNAVVKLPDWAHPVVDVTPKPAPLNDGQTDKRS